MGLAPPLNPPRPGAHLIAPSNRSDWSPEQHPPFGQRAGTHTRQRRLARTELQVNRCNSAHLMDLSCESSASPLPVRRSRSTSIPMKYPVNGSDATANATIANQLPTILNTGLSARTPARKSTQAVAIHPPAPIKTYRIGFFTFDSRATGMLLLQWRRQRFQCRKHRYQPDSSLRHGERTRRCPDPSLLVQCIVVQ